jgi:hypothetical protein
MANTIPCPNPVCTHDFSLAEVQSAAPLLCPKCGFRMQGKAAAPSKQAAPAAPAAKPAVSKPAAPAKPAPPTAAAIKRAAAPLAKPAVAQPIAIPAKGAVAAPVPAPTKPVAASNPPLAMPVAAQTKPASGVAAGSPPLATPTAAPPAAAPVGSEESLPDGAFFNPDVGITGTLVRTGGPKNKKFNWIRLLIILFAVGFAACVVIVAIGTLSMIMGGRNLGNVFENSEPGTYIGNIRNAKNESEKVYRLVLPKKDWLINSEIASRFGGVAEARQQFLVTAYQHAEYDFWFALIAKDHGLYKPRAAEMLRTAVDKLEFHFGEALELDAKAEPVKFGALPAQKLQFRGEYKSVKWLGECYMFFNNGIAYWLFTASPDENLVVSYAEKLPLENIFIESERRGWREQPWPTETFPSIGGKLDMTAPKGVWDKADPKSEDENGVLLLAGRYLREKDNSKNALLLVFTMDKKDDPIAAMKAAREHLNTKAEGDNKNAKVVHAADVAPGQTEQGELEDIGNRRGRMIDLKLQITDEPDPQRYYLLAVVNEPDVCYVIVCECSWRGRQIWRQDFLDVLRTLRVKKGE